MSGLEALVFFGIIVVLCLVSGVLTITFIKLSQYKEQKAFKVNKDLAKAKREWYDLQCQLQDYFCEKWKIERTIDKEIEKQKYMTKVELVIQDKELEKLKYRIKALQGEIDKLSPIVQELEKKYIELRKKYKLRVDE